MGKVTWRRREDWVGSHVEDTFVMINLDSGEYVALNETATEIWNLLETPSDSDALADTLCRTFAIERDDCIRAVDALLVEMQTRQLADPVG